MNFATETLLMRQLYEDTCFKGRDFAPMLLCYRHEEKLAVGCARPLAVGTQEDKLAAFGELFSLVPATEADAILFAADFWVSTNPNVPPHADPSAMDALNIFTMHRGDTVGSSHAFPYFRGHDGRLFWVTISPYSTPAASEGDILEVAMAAFATSHDDPSEIIGRRLAKMGHKIALVLGGHFISL